MSDSLSRGAASAARLEAAAETLLAETRKLPEDAIGWKPADDVWSVMEILGHVAELVPYWTGQALQIIREPKEQWGRNHADAARLDAVQRAKSRTLADVSDEIKARVEAASAALRGLSDAELTVEAVSRNPRWGLQPASFVVDHLLVEHVVKHTGQIQRNAGQFRQRAVA
jgi:uncharacterized damage-inducible protein DinB